MAGCPRNRTDILVSQQATAQQRQPGDSRMVLVTRQEGLARFLHVRAIMHRCGCLHNATHAARPLLWPRALLSTGLRTHLMPGLLSSTSRSRFATRSPSGPMYSLFFTPAPPLAPPPCAEVPPAPAGPPAAGPLPGRLFQLSTRDGTGRPPALVLLMVVPRRRLAAAAVLGCVLLPSERAGCLRAQDGMRSSGFVPCTQNTQPQVSLQARKRYHCCACLCTTCKQRILVACALPTQQLRLFRALAVGTSTASRAMFAVDY
jgi:hypothetical protein